MTTCSVTSACTMAKPTISGSDLEPLAQVQDASRLQDLAVDAQRLSGKKGDPKLAALIRHIGSLLEDGYHPVVFCRYVATAHYAWLNTSRPLSPRPPSMPSPVSSPPEERRERVEDLEDAEQRILVATDRLKVLNLQHLSTAVVHYDLAWELHSPRTTRRPSRSLRPAGR